jgi:hypothetical protein
MSKLADLATIKPPTPRSEKFNRRDYYSARIGEAEGRGDSADAAVGDLRKKIKIAFAGNYDSYVLSFRSLIAIGWRTPDGWEYHVIDKPGVEPVEKRIWGVNSGYASPEDMLKSMRNQLAWGAWDDQEEHSPILQEEEQADFKRGVIWQKRFRELKATGMEDTSIRNQLFDERL